MASTSIAGIAIEGDKVLIAYRNPTGQMASRWEFPGGKVEEGETEAEAVVREFKEEFGIEVSVHSRIAEASFEHNGKSVALHAYHIRVPHNGLLEPYTLTEHTEYRWAPVDEIEKLPFVDSDMLIYPTVRAFVKNGGALC